jgi:hypothetical protein
MTRLPLLFAIAATGCGGGWTDKDTTSLQDSVRDQAAGLELCGGDAGACNAGQVRALDRATYCTLAATLFRHGQTIPDGGVSCQPLQ